MKPTTLKKALLAGTAIVAAGAFSPMVIKPAYAADTEMAGAAGTPTNMLTGFTSGDDLVNIVDDANDFGTVDADNGVTATTLQSDFTGGLAVYDGTNDTTSGDTLTVSTYMDVATGTTFTLVFGGTIADGSGTDGAEEVTLAIGTTLGDTGATTLTRGGTLAIVGTANEPDGPGTFTVAGNTLMTSITHTGGAGGAAAGGAVTSTFGNASTDTYNVTGATVVGGAGSGAADGVAGGASTVTVNGAATIGASNLAVTGGAAGAGAGAGAAGGAATMTFNHGTTLTGSVTVTGGADHNSAGGAGGDAAVTFTGDVTSTSTLLVSTGAQAAGGGGLSGDGSATFGGDVTFTAITMNDNGDGAATLTFNGTDAQTVAGTIDGVGAAEGNIVISNSDGVTFTGKVGNTQGAALITISTTGGDSAATFENTLTATQINLGDGAGTGTNTLTLDSTDNDFTATALIDGTAGDTDNVVATGGGVITIAGKIGNATAVESLSIGADTQVIASSTVYNVTDVTLASGSELNVTGAATITGDINGNGTLDLDNDVSVVGSIGDSNDLTAIEIATGKVLTVSGAAADRTIDATTITLQGAASGLTLTPGANDIIVAEDIDTAVDGAGVLIVSDGAGTVTYQGDVGASTSFSLATFTSLGGTNQTITANGNWFVDQTDLDDEDVLILLGSDVTVSGAVDGTADSDGIVRVGNGTDAAEVTFSSALGATNDLEAFQVKAMSTANTAGSVSIITDAATDAGLDVDGTLNIDTDGGAITYTIATGDADFDGTVEITGANNATFTVGDDIFIDGASTFTTALDSGKTLTITSTGDDIDIGLSDDTTIVADNQITINGNVNFGTGAVAADDRIITITTGSTAFDATAAYVITAAGDTMDFDADSVVRFGINSGYTGLEDGDIILFINSDENATLDTVAKTYVELETAGAIELIDTALIDFSVSTAGTEAQDLEILATFNDATDVLDESTSGAAQALIDFETATGELLEARGNLLAAADADAAHEVAEALAPTVDAGAQIATVNLINHTGQIGSTRLASLRTGAESGIAAGEIASGTHVWGQVFGTHGNQDDRDGVDGFDFDTVGVAVGADTSNVADNATVGVLLSYADTDVESDNATSTETEIDNFQVALYGDYDMANRVYVAGQVGYAWGDNETTRHNVGGIAGLTADGEYDSSQWIVRAEVGRDYDANGAKVTPKLLADYTHYSADDYTETGAGGANLTVDSDAVNVFNVGAGVDASWKMDHPDGAWTEPALHAAVRYDLANDNVETSSSFAGGGASFNTVGPDPARASLDLGGSLTYHATTNWDFKAQYGFGWKEDYTSHTGVLKAGYKF